MKMSLVDVTERYVLVCYVPFSYIMVKSDYEDFNAMGGEKNLLAREEEASGLRKTAAERIFDTARSLFYHRGIRAVGVDEIVCQAGVTKPSLYRAFASKDALVAACLSESAREGSTAIDNAICEAGCDPREQLRAIVHYFSDKVTGPDYRGCPMSNAAVEFPEPGHPVRAVLESCKSDIRERLVSLTRELHVKSPEVLADGLVLLIEGAMASHHIYGSRGPSSAIIATADALIDAHLASAATH